MAVTVRGCWLYDDEDIVREIRGAAIFMYIHGPGVDEPLAREEGSTTLSYYHADGLGSILKRTSQAGAVVHEYRYDAWGRLEAGATEPGYAFTGREWDPEIRLAFYRARYYDPSAGVFLSDDTHRWTEGPNLRQYAGGNPTSFVDPWGTSITANVLPLPWRFVDQTCKPGSDGATCLDSPVKFKSPGCRKKDSAWGFDAEVNAQLWVEFVWGVDPPVDRSKETPSLSMWQHELLHVHDIVTGLENLDKMIQTEGFRTPEECKCALAAFEGNLANAITKIVDTSEQRRDKNGNTNIP